MAEKPERVRMTKGARVAHVSPGAVEFRQATGWVAVDENDKPLSKTALTAATTDKEK